MENLKSETIKIVTPVGTRFRYSYLVTPDEYLGVEKWKTEALIPVGTKIKNEQGELVEATVFIVDKLEALLESWKSQLKAAFPNKNFTLTKSSKTGQPSFPWSFEEDICRAPAGALQISCNKTEEKLQRHEGYQYTCNFL